MHKKVKLLPKIVFRLFIPAVASLLMLSSCSMKSAYLQLDWIIPQYIEKYIDLTQIQEHQLQINLSQTLNWHRKTQLPAYISWLKSFHLDINRGLTQNQVLQHSQQLEKFYKITLNKFIPSLVVSLISTTQTQKDNLFVALEKENIEYKEKYILPDEATIREQLLEQISDQFEFWLGELNPQQEQLISQASKNLKLIGPLRLKNRRIWQNKLKQILKKNNSLNTLKPSITHLLLQADELYEKKYRQTLDYNKAVMFSLIVNLSRHLNPDQKQYLLKKTDYYINVFEELHIKQ